MAQINWRSLIFMIVTYSLGLLGGYFLFTEAFSISFIAFNVFYYLYNNLAFTIGWHRYFVHKSFKTSKAFEWVLFLGGASLFIGSLSEWIHDHSRHHKNLNTMEDPTNINQGFFYSHLGWALVNQNKELTIKNSLLKYWHKTYLVWAFIFGLLIPVTISYLLSGQLFVSICISFGLRVLMSQNIIGLLGSYCHVVKDPHSIDSHLISLICFGEGYQEYHHEYPGDYRNGPRGHQIDSSKWIIFLLSKIGLVKDLRRKE